MNRLNDIYQSYLDAATIEEVSQVFETVASIEVRQIKDRVIASRQFFHELWSLYAQLRIDKGDKQDTFSKPPTIFDKSAAILISSEESLGGSIDEQLIEETLSATDSQKTDYFVIGQRGARILRSRGITPSAIFALPDITKPVNVVPIIAATQDYASTVVYFEQFVSIGTQQIQVFELISGVTQLSQIEARREDTTLIFSSEYIFEPSLGEVVEYLESMMRSTALTELILESRLAQLASRFNTMSRASQSAKRQKNAKLLQYRRGLRQKRDASSTVYYNKRELVK